MKKTQEETQQTRRFAFGCQASFEEIGLGDVVKRMTYAAGIRPCGGCQKRAAALNRRVIFTR
jgi:hypothetical protein